MIESDDGVRFDTSGEYRIVTRPDGLYVVGHGMVCPVDSEEEGEELIECIKSAEAAP